ncbi:MAG: hypothetical protein GQ570_02770 [Helicobacteraceae bacterium]|nr:hypothetical protein [Helicobacteraceae bacterium]
MFSFLSSLKQHDMLGIRVAISIAIVFLISYLFSLERSYWAVITIISVNISINFADILARSWFRLLSSVLGLFSGTLIYHYLLCDSSSLVLYIALMISAGATLFFMFINYPLAMFFNSLFVVFIFVSFGNWNEHLLEVRLFQTLLGSVVSLVVAYLLINKNSTTVIFNDVMKLYDETAELLNNFESMSESRFVEFQKVHQLQEEISLAMLNSKFDYKNQKFYIQVKATLPLFDELIYTYDQWYDMYKKMEKNNFLDQMYSNLNIAINSKEQFRSPDLSATTVQEEVIKIYYELFLKRAIELKGSCNAF